MGLEPNTENSNHYMPQWRFQSASRVTLLCSILGRVFVMRSMEFYKCLRQKPHCGYHITTKQWHLTSCKNGLNPVYTTSIFNLWQKINTKKRRVCYQAVLKQLKLFMELSSSILSCQLRKLYLTQFILLLLTTQRLVITMLKDMTELKNITGFVTHMYGNFWGLGCELSVSEESSDMKISFFILMDPLHHTYIQLLQIFCDLLNQQFCQVRMSVCVCLHEREKKMCFQIITAFLCYRC